MGDSAGAFSAVINNQATPLGARYSVYLLYWYKILLVQTHFRRSLTIKQRLWGPGTPFTCFTGKFYWYKRIFGGH